MAQRIVYDEFSMFHEYSEEFGVPFDGPPTVRREFVEVEPERRLSALVWGRAEPDLVLLHGGGQNAHTWDTVALALGRPLVAIDLPGHGHSDGGKVGSLGLRDNAADVAVAVQALAPTAQAVVGMSLGGHTTLALATHAPDVVRKVVLVDVLPTRRLDRASHIAEFLNGPESFPDFDEILARTVKYNPTRSESSLRRGILHNAEQRYDGSWVWRHQRHRRLEARDASGKVPLPDFDGMWRDLEHLRVPVLLCRGMRADSVLGDDDEVELRRRRPDARIEHFDEAGHSIQGDMPVELAQSIEGFVFT